MHHRRNVYALENKRLCFREQMSVYVGRCVCVGVFVSVYVCACMCLCVCVCRIQDGWVTSRDAVLRVSTHAVLRVSRDAAIEAFNRCSIADIKRWSTRDGLLQ